MRKCNIPKSNTPMHFFCSTLRLRRYLERNGYFCESRIHKNNLFSPGIDATVKLIVFECKFRETQRGTRTVFETLLKHNPVHTDI